MIKKAKREWKNTRVVKEEDFLFPAELVDILFDKNRNLRDF